MDGDVDAMTFSAGLQVINSSDRARRDRRRRFDKRNQFLLRHWQDISEPTNRSNKADDQTHQTDYKAGDQAGSHQGDSKGGDNWICRWDWEINPFFRSMFVCVRIHKLKNLR